MTKEEILQILKELKPKYEAVQIGDSEIEAQAGDILLIPAGVPHGYRTIGDEPYSFLCLVPNREDKIEILSC